MGGRTPGVARERMTGAVEAGILTLKSVAETSPMLPTRMLQDDIS
jgi:hypothetical protein